jgi:hypothetical protein
MKHRRNVTSIVLAVAVFLGVVAWLHDFITLDGARTVYTVTCANGQWRGAACTGTLRAGDRYRFRTLKNHSEVIFWVAGSREASGKLAPCEVENAKQWTCKPGPDSARTITHEMRFGQPVPEPRGPARAFHPVAKWKWLLLDRGATLFHQADA